MATSIRARVIFEALALAVLVSGGRAAAAPEGDSAEKIYQRTLKSTVYVLVPRRETSEGTQYASGSGSVIDVGRKLVLTNEHVVGNSERAIILFPVYQKGKLVAERDFYVRHVSKEGIKGKVVAKDSKRDLAVIQLEALPQGVQRLELSASSPGPGQRVHSIGNPGRSGGLWIYTSGTVRQVYHKKWRTVEPSGGSTEREAQVVETQSPTNPGDSGGPLVNDRGQLVAVTQGAATGGQLLSTFVDVSEVRAFLTSKKLLPRGTPPAVASGNSGERPKPSGEKPIKIEEDTERVEQVASARLSLAKALADEGKVEKAVERCETIIKMYPNTKAATEAKKLVEKLKK